MYHALKARGRLHLLRCVVVLLLLSVVFYAFSSTVYINYSEIKDIPINPDCYYLLEEDALLSVEDPKFSPGDKAIFFHETSCRGGINSRQACTVESAARLHPHWQINLLFSAPVTEHTLRQSNLAKLLQFRNVKFARLHIEEYAKDTIVEPILRSMLNISLHLVEHSADILRILTLNKFGGVYLDTDSMIVKSLSSLPRNWIAEELKGDIASGAMGFSKDGVGNSITTAILKEVRESFDPSSWSQNGPEAIQRVLTRICPEVLNTTGNCKGLKILPSRYFYPVHYSVHQKYFNSGNLDDIYKKGVYMHHMWNHITHHLKIKNNSPYAKLARRFCPTIYEMYGNRFGD